MILSRRALMGLLGGAAVGPAFATPDATQAQLQEFLNGYQSLKDQVKILENPRLKITMPTYSLYVDQVNVGDPFVTARVRRDAITNVSLTMRWHIVTNQLPAGYTPVSAVPAVNQGEFCFDYDMDEVVIQIPNNISGTKAYWVEIYNPRHYGTLSWLTDPLHKKVLASMTASVTPTLNFRGRSRMWNQQIPRPVPGGWFPDHYDDLLTNFESTSTGFRADGVTPCYRTGHAHNPDPTQAAIGQFNNSEVGANLRPDMWAGQQCTPYQVIDGKRALVAEKLLTPITASQGGITKTFTWSSPFISTQMMPLRGYGRFEAKIAFPNPTKGMWPSWWNLVLPHQRWPDAEQDVVEINFNATAAQIAACSVLPYQTNWWDKGGGSSSMQGQFANVCELQPSWSHGNFNTYWMDYTPELMRWGVNDFLTLSTPCMFPQETISDPNHPEYSNKLYSILEIAIGGAGGDPNLGTYPASLLVDHIAHYAMPT